MSSTPRPAVFVPSLARLLTLALASVLLMPVAQAEKPAGVGQGKAPAVQVERRPMVELRFGMEERRAVHDWYEPHIRAGHCPPGLAKKNNGCLPPGQARQWKLGQPLPAGLQRYPLPPELLIRLPIPPAGHEFVRVATDILLIAVGTGIVIDAIQDLGR